VLDFMEGQPMTDPIGSSVRGRLDYQPIHKRPPLRLPKHARVAVWTIVNVENWSPAAAMPRAVLPPPMGQPLLPDIPNWAWHEYGIRVGFWRFLETLSSRKLKATFAINGSVCSLYPEVCEAAREAEWDFMGHGFVQKPMHKVEDQRAAIADTINAITAFTGKPPRGWESPGLTETDETLDLLAEAGIEYVADWAVDDQPGAAEDARGHDRLGALHGRDQRRRHQCRATAAVGRDLPTRARPVRPALSRRRQGAPGDGDLDPSLSHRRAAPDQIS
jgi:hypothetical protein